MSKAHRVRLALALFSSTLLFQFGVAYAGNNWRTARANVNAALKDYRKFSGDRANEDAYRPLVVRFEKSLEAALSSHTSGPPSVKRIRTVLPHVAEWPPGA